MELTPNYISTYYNKNVGNMKQSQKLAINIQQHCLENQDTDNFINTLQSLCYLKPYLTETSLSSEFVTRTLENLSFFINTVNAANITSVLIFFTVFLDFLCPQQCNDIMFLIILILKKFSVPGLSKDSILSSVLLKLIMIQIQQHHIEFLTQNQAEEFAKYIAYNSNYLLNSGLIANVLWEINKMYDIMGIVNETLSNSKNLSYVIQTVLELSKLLVQHGYQYQFSNKFTNTISDLLILKLSECSFKFDETALLQNQMSSSIYIVSQVMSGVIISKEIQECALQTFRKCVCRTQNESEFNSFCMTILAQ
ncbi:Hypothetical_protein [Hexamita inflata]|uniref:Hypothetical_protein n=1 Tax=Hexamita inflata TaxID=28002 RepID=A0AA86PVU2_9EUKA|nr:Hypothetical protein HINF_LOCUS29094 [Hexamita inflata]